MVNVLEGRKLLWSNPEDASSYVLVVLGKKKFRTNLRKNAPEPVYREDFIFELYVSIQDIQRSSMWVAVMETRFQAVPRLLGETSIDLGAVWAQPHHQVYHKWTPLILPRDPNSGPVGYIKLDIAIAFKGDLQLAPSMESEEKIEENLLMPCGSEQQPARYQISIYGAFSLPNTIPSHGDRRHGKPPSTYVRVSFCGLVGKTSIQPHQNNPSYCEQISVVETFPNLNQLIRFEVCSTEACFNRVIGCSDLRLEQVSHDGDNGFLPTFGPSLLHMYGTSVSGTLGTTGEDGPFYGGALLVSLKTIVPYLQQGFRNVTVEPIKPLAPEQSWINNNLCVMCPILEVSMLDYHVVGASSGVAITMGEVPIDKSDDEEYMAMRQELALRKLHYTGSMNVMTTHPAYGYIQFQVAYPVLQLAPRLPDFRFRMFRNNLISGIIDELELALFEVESRLDSSNYTSPSELTDELHKAIDIAAKNILQFLNNIQTQKEESVVKQNSTELDEKQLVLQRDQLEQIYNEMASKKLTNKLKECAEVPANKKSVKLLLAETKTFAQRLKKTIYKMTDGWPDIIIWILNEGSRVAFTKISVADVIYSSTPEQCGSDCGRIQTVYMKPLKCPKHIDTLSSGCLCIAAKVELMLWAGLFHQRQAFDDYLPPGYFIEKQNFDMCIKATHMILELRAFIYRARLVDTSEGPKLCYPFVRLNTMNTVAESVHAKANTTPTWNQLLRIQKVVYTSADRLMTYPPLVLVEIHDTDLLERVDFIGRFQIHPVVDDRPSYDNAPKLKWYDIYKGVEYVGKIQMSLQLLQVPEKLLKTTVYSSKENVETNYTRDNPPSDDIEPLPPNLIPQSSTYKMDLYWWGLRDVSVTRKPCIVLEYDDLVIKSDSIADKKPNSNFPNGRITHVFTAPVMNGVDTPHLNIRLYDSSTFGRTMFLGTKVIKNPKKYVVNWLPKTERDTSLKSASLVSDNFLKVNQIVYVNYTVDNEEYPLSDTPRSSHKPKVKRFKWRNIFINKEPLEEEYSLLPIYTKERYEAKKLKTIIFEQNDWWKRLSGSIKESDMPDDVSGKIKIYSSELENQKEFSKFKDWCFTLKLYNGKKTGIPKEDEHLQCGYLKAGIVIYDWPPPPGTVAVSKDGIDLSQGYFCDYPPNDPKKFLVRIYVVKGVSLVTKDLANKTNPYVVISCNRKKLGDRNNYVANSSDPVFGKVYEFRCTLPEDYLLKVSLYDFDTMNSDDLIGTTTIDLEDRAYSKHRARVGLSSQYSLSGPSRWRDFAKPSDILEELCQKHHMPQPVIKDDASVLINGIEYRSSKKDECYASPTERKENLCLNLLHKWHTLPICGYHLVPEHVETRTLYNLEKPGFEMGKIQMWVDIFPLDSCSTIPSAIDIKPRTTESYELRVIVRDIKNLQETLRPDRSKSRGLYIKAWLGSPDNAQFTDVYRRRSNSGFNWRMIFHFQYRPSDKKLVSEDKGPFTEFIEYMPPVLVVQLFEGGTDNTMGLLSFNITSLPPGALSSQRCSLDDLISEKKIDLFCARSLRAWFPIKMLDFNTGCSTLVSTMDLEMNLLTKEEALMLPVSIGREHTRRSSIVEQVSKDNKLAPGKIEDDSVIRCVLKKIFMYASISFAVGVLLLSIMYFIAPCGMGFPYQEPNSEEFQKTLYPARQ